MDPFHFYSFLYRPWKYFFVSQTENPFSCCATYQNPSVGKPRNKGSTEMCVRIPFQMWDPAEESL